MKVVKYLIGWFGKGVKTYYVTGNHDEMLRRFVGLRMGSLISDRNRYNRQLSSVQSAI